MKKFDIEIKVKDQLLKKTFIGTNEAAHDHAMDQMNELAQTYICDNEIVNTEEQEEIIDSATYTLTYDDDFIAMYAVCRNNGIIVGVYYNLADALMMADGECSIQEVKVYGVQEVEE